MIIAGLDHEIYEDSSSPASPSESYAFDASRSSRSFQIRDATPERRYLTAKALLGYVDVLTEGSRRYIHRQAPYANPPVSDPDLNPNRAPSLWCKSIPHGAPVPSVPSADPQTGAATYAAYRFAAEFRSLPYAVKEDYQVFATAGPLAAGGGLNSLPDEGDCLRRGIANTRYITISVQPGIKRGVLKEGSLRFEASPGPGPLVGVGIPIAQYTAHVIYTWYEIPYSAVPWKAIVRCAENVNGPIGAGGIFDGFAAGTLLLESTAIRTYTCPLSPRLLCDVEYRMAYLPNEEERLTGGVRRLLGHNSIYSVIPAPQGDGGDYYYVNTSGMPGAAGGRYPHSYEDFSTLFRPDQP